MTMQEYYDEMRDDINIVLQLAEDELNSIQSDADQGDEDSQNDWRKSREALDRLRPFIERLPEMIQATPAVSCGAAWDRMDEVIKETREVTASISAAANNIRELTHAGND